MRSSFISFIIIVLWMISSCYHPEENSQGDIRFPEKLEGELTITGAFALAPLIQACADSFSIKYPGANITILSIGSELAMKTLLNSKADLAMISRPLTADEEEKLFVVPVARTGAVMIFNSNNPYKDIILSHGLSIHDLQKIYSGNSGTTWDEFLGKREKIPLLAYTRQDPSGTAEVIAGFIYMNQHEMKGALVTGETRMIEAIRGDSLALGYCNINDAFDLSTGERLLGLEFLPVDLNMNGSIEQREEICNKMDDFQNSICNNTYPFKLSRNLYLVSLDKPEDELALSFMKWVLSDGQELVKRMGYSEIPSSLLKYNLFLLR